MIITVSPLIFEKYYPDSFWFFIRIPLAQAAHSNPEFKADLTKKEPEDYAVDFGMFENWPAI